MAVRRRRSDRSGMAKLCAPGRPTARRAQRQQFWVGIAAGLFGQEAAASARISPAVGVRWFREAGVCHHRILHRRRRRFRGGTCRSRSVSRSLSCALSPIGIKRPGMIGVMEPISGMGNGHPGGAKNGWISQRWQGSIYRLAERPSDAARRVPRVPGSTRYGAAGPRWRRPIAGCWGTPGPIL